MNPNFEQFKALVQSPLKFKMFMLRSLPAAYFAGLRIEAFDETTAVISVKQKWFNKNPFGSIYFAVLTMAAEMSTGVLSMANVFKRKPSVSMLVVSTDASFYKKATGKILFTCNDGAAIAGIIEEAIKTGEGKTITCTSTGRNEMGEVVAAIQCTWSFKAKTKA
ncbi:DUF4442 domain-containing protein [Panacibacter microcysteis]